MDWKRLFFCGFLLMTANAKEKEMELTLKETRWSTGIVENWQNAVPTSAKVVSAEFGKVLDLRKLDASAAEFLVYMKIAAPADGRVCFGMGADWFMEAFINGKPCLNTMKSGNMTDAYAPWNFPLYLPVKKGENLLAVKVKAGSLGARFIAGKSSIAPYEGPVKLEKRTTPFVSPERSGNSYRLIVLGDTHFDAPYEVYHAKYNEPDARLNRIQRAEFARNEKMWRERGPRLLKAAASHVNADTRAVIQLGDLIQGDCGDPEVHKKMMLDTLEAFKKNFNSLPLLTVTGNHDIRGTGAKKAYEEIMPQYHSGVLKQKISKNTFYFTVEQDLFLFIDFNSPDLLTIFEAFEKHAGARYKFVITHGPVIPSKSTSPRWCFAGNNDHIRRTFRELFLKHDVIVLTGHVHRQEVTECVTDEGRITQLMANSVWEEEKLAVPTVSCTSPSDYGSGVKSEFKEFFEEYKNAVTQHWRAAGAGYFVLDITPGSIKACGFGGDLKKPFKTWEFKK